MSKSSDDNRDDANESVRTESVLSTLNVLSPPVFPSTVVSSASARASAVRRT